MKFFISVDIEGAGSVVSSLGLKKDDQLYRELLTGEVNAVIEGILKTCKSAKEILVCDSHNEGENILPDKLNQKAMLVRGYPRSLYMMTGLDNTFGMVFLVGYHAKAGTLGAVLDHTFSGKRVQRIILNGREIGEFDLSAGLAAHYGVPVGFASGDDKFEKEVAETAPWVKVAVTKYALARYAAKTMHPAKVGEILRAKASEACKDIKKMKHLRFHLPLSVSIDFAATVMADMACLIPSIKRVNGKRISFETGSFPEFYDLLHAIVTLAHSVN